MRTLHVQKRELDLTEYKMRSAVESDFSTLIEGDTMIYEGDTLMIVCLQLDLDCSDIVSALNRVQYHTEARTDGLLSRSRVFGHLPRNTIRRDFCTASSLAKDQPSEHAIVASYALKVAEYYRQLNPALYEQHQQTATDNVVGEFQIKGSPFTSGIINKNNPLKYHFDTGNFKDVWSAMLVFKGGTEGGYLSVPEYDMGFKLPNNSLFMFDGQGLLHGVTPIRKTRPDAWRYSIVYYSMREMWNCLPITDELLRIRKLRTEREEKRTQPRTKADIQDKRKR